MISNIIFYAVAVVVSVLFGIGIGKKKGYISGWLKGKEFEREYWIKNMPSKEVNRVLNKEYNTLMNLVFSSDEEFEEKYLKEDD